MPTAQGAPRDQLAQHHLDLELGEGAGVNAKALSSHMGHSAITMTLDRYSHPMPGNEDALTAYGQRRSDLYLFAFIRSGTVVGLA